MHLCHAEECITSFCFCCSVTDSLSSVQYLSHNLGLTPPSRRHVSWGSGTELNPPLVAHTMPGWKRPLQWSPVCMCKIG